MRNFTLLKTHTAETLLQEIEQIQKRITERACEVFRNRGAALGTALNDWVGQAFIAHPRSGTARRTSQIRRAVNRTGIVGGVN